MRNTRLKDIAETVGVSTTAVCNVLNGKPIRISGAKRQEILALAKKLNYKPDIIASGLKSRSSKSVGVVIPDMRTLFYPEIIRVIENGLRPAGYHTIICNTGDSCAIEKEQIENLFARKVDALVLAPANGAQNLEFLRSVGERGVPMIMIDRYYKNESFNFAVTDNEDGAAAGVRALLNLRPGLKRVVYLGSEKRNQPLDDRLEGVRKEAARAKLTFSRGDLFLTSLEREDIRASGLRILAGAGEKTGVFLESNRFLPGFLDAAQKLGKTIPKDAPVTGFDAFELRIDSAEDLGSVRALKEPIPIIHQDIDGMSRAAVGYLLSRLGGGPPDELRLKLPVVVS
jgi:LacI family transcriptional regulator